MGFFATMASPAPGGEDIVVKEGLHLRLPRQLQRSVLAVDPVEMAIAAGTWRAPKAGEAVVFSAAEKGQWNEVGADANGWFSTPGDGYLYAVIRSPQDNLIILNGLGDSYAYVNGELRMGAKYAVKDAYESWEPRFDYGQVPVLLKKGENRFLFRANRGRLKAVLSPPPAPILLNDKDATLPDVLVGERVEAWGAVVVINGKGQAQRDLALAASGEGLEPTATPVGPLPAMSLRKVPFLIKGRAPRDPSKITVKLSLLAGGKVPNEALHEIVLPLEAKSPLQNHKRTFRSAIDGSIQYYAVNPAQSRDPASRPALVLSVHGAGVEAVNQAASYESKAWVHIVAPTNRRPYGFDWEDWGRIDALEAKADFSRRYPVDPARVYLTGHSMGGHGAWILGVQFPDLFAALGPSAGWISFRTYASRQKDEGPTEVEKLAARPLLQGDTLALVRNTLNRGVYILHGEKDESVPVAQAREMAKALAEFHKDFVYHEEKDAGHWWDKSDEPGTDCVDWAPMFDFFARRALPAAEEVREVEFVTANPGISARCHWATIEAQVESLKLSSIRLRLDPGARRISGTTQNVARLALDLAVLPEAGEVTVDLDGQTLKVVPRDKTLWLYRRGETWAAGERPSPSLKGPHRSGPFKDAFRNDMIFVYGTAGNSEENAWAFQKARFDAECFLYQGNGSIEIVADKDFDPSAEPDRNVILYGNATTNKAWVPLLGDGDMRVERGIATVGETRLFGKDLACLFLKPRPNSDVACVGVVSGTGILGMRLTNTRPYLYAGYALPDLIIFDSGVNKSGGPGLKLAGFFGPDWKAASGEFLRD
jgi:pimeloyl-ACP methyl ester carboxylesterase